MSADARLVEVKQRAARRLMTIPGVTAVGIGGRERDGRPTGEIVLKVFVERKRPPEELTPGAALPPRYDGVGIDVSELSAPTLQTEPDPLEEASDEPPGSALRDGADRRKYRPVIGGGAVQVELAEAGAGTLGCILVHKTDPAKVYALTNFHVVSAGGRRLPTQHSTHLGQPTNFSSSTKCCSDLIGTFVAGSEDVTRDAALIQLDPGTQWMAEIAGIGTVAGTHSVTPAEAATLTYPVRKRGARTRLTGGVVEAIDTTISTNGIVRDNVMIVRPNPNDLVPPSATVYFSDHRDSGSVILNSQSEVVALLFAGALDGVNHLSKGLGLPIAAVLGLFDLTDGLPVAVATATTDGVVQTVPGPGALRVPEELTPALMGTGPDRRVLAPAGSHALPGTQAPTPEVLAAIRTQLTASPAGRQVAALWLQHQPELLSLLHQRRRVALVWHRCGGPALVQTLIRMVERPDLALPQTVNGEPLASCLGRIHDAFAAQATPDLRRALRTARAALPDLAGLTYPQIVAALDAG